MTLKSHQFTHLAYSVREKGAFVSLLTILVKTGSTAHPDPEGDGLPNLEDEQGRNTTRNIDACNTGYMVVTALP